MFAVDSSKPACGADTARAPKCAHSNVDYYFAVLEALVQRTVREARWRWIARSRRVGQAQFGRRSADQYRYVDDEQSKRSSLALSGLTARHQMKVVRIVS